jgi:hypothetical protein
MQASSNSPHTINRLARFSLTDSKIPFEEEAALE